MLQVFGLCRVGSDIYFKQLKSGNNLAKFRVGASERRKEETKWHNASVTFWGKQADVLHKYVKKGQSIVLHGELVENTYEKDGEEKTGLEIRGSRFEFVGDGSGGKKKSRDEEDEDDRDERPAKKKAKAEEPDDDDGDEDEKPAKKSTKKAKKTEDEDDGDEGDSIPF